MRYFTLMEKNYDYFSHSFIFPFFFTQERNKRARRTKFTKNFNLASSNFTFVFLALVVLLSELYLCLSILTSHFAQTKENLEIALKCSEQMFQRPFTHPKCGVQNISIWLEFLKG